jgi:ArsR family transcriptional regulator
MSRKRLTPELFAAIAGRFKALAEPARLRVLDALRRGPLHGSALMERTGLNQANLSRHLQVLHAHGFVARRRDGLFVYYEIADASVFTLCDVMCGGLERSARLRLAEFKVQSSKFKKRPGERVAL